MKIKFCGLLLIFLFIITGCDSNDDEPPPPHPELSKLPEAKTEPVNSALNFDELSERASQILFQGRPVDATLYGLDLEQVGEYYNNQLPDYSPEAELKFRKTLFEISKSFKELKSADNASAADNQAVMADIVRYYAGHPEFDIGYIDVWMGLSPYIINQINGPLLDIPRTIQNDQPITNEQQALDYIARLAQFDQFTQSIVQKFNYDMEKGWIPPKEVLQGALKYLNKFTKPKPEKHPLAINFFEKIESVDSLSLDQKAVLTDELTRQMEDVVYPAYKSVAENVAAALDKAREEDGIWAQPNGEKYYQDAILQLGNSTLRADDIHQIGLNEVKRISAEMNKILNPMGYNKGSVGQKMKRINLESRFLYPDSDEGRATLLADLNKYIEEINAKMGDLFKTKPPYQVEVRAFPEEVQDGAPGGQYTPPALDGSKPGIYWINLRDMKANPKYGLKTLTYHEANPGHHWQIALNLAQDDLPLLRRIAPYNAYVEGWALYSELVAKEIGMYEKDPFGDLGRLQAELFRAVRLVVDTGLHHKKWTREKAIKYMADTTGSADSEVVSEIERYMAWPGQALGYKLGMLKIVELRENAQKKLGEQFDLAEFHDLVLLGGAVPMTVLEQRVERWIAKKSS
ncbi:DUF885 domain-containing protein [Pleionea sediminis]|uniref:DUF885 domain-containing protein n=1 Tax=Pleionea sediminis TaxID=2569479 RepID=UPI0011858E80|nr:DUF885 domain-containing protein [Pleionea sediminis]